MTGLVVAIAEAFPTDIPAGTRGGVVVPLGTIPCVFTRKIALPNLIVLHEKIHDGGSVFDDALPFGFVGLPFFILPLSVIPWHRVSSGIGVLGEGLIKLGGRITLRELLSTILRTLSKQTRQLLTIKQLECF